MKMTLLRVLLLATVICSTIEQELFEVVQFRSDNNAREKQAYFMKTFLKLYTGFSLMFHMENSTAFGISYLLKLVNEHGFGEIVIINEDTLQYVDFQLRKGLPYLHVVLLKELNKFSGFLNMPGCLISSDVVLFVLLNNNKAFKEEFWRMPKLDWAGNVIILSVDGGNVSIYNVCYYCGEFTQKLHYLESGNSTLLNINKHRNNLLASNFTNFYNHKFKIGFVESFPFLFCHIYHKKKEQNETRRCAFATGQEMGILEILKKKLNFNYELHEYAYSLSTYDKDINREGFLEMDFVIGGLSITAANAPKMSFTSILAFEPVTFVYIPRKSEYSELFDILKPFKTYLWVVVMSATIWFSLCLYTTVKVMNSLNCKIQLPLSKCFKMCFKPIIEQTDKIKLNAFKPYFSPCVILAIWWLASNIIATAYKSKLWAIYIKTYRIEPSNLQELLDNKYSIIVNSQNEDIMRDIFSANDPLILEAKRKLIIKYRTCPVLSYILNNKAAMLDEYATIQYHALVRCSDMLPPDVYSKLRITRTPLRQTTHSWPLQMGAPYKDAFDNLIGLIESAGLQRKWKTDSLSVLRNKYDSIPFSQTNALAEQDEEEKLLQGFASAFALYFIGNFTAVVCFIGELACQGKLSKRKRL